MLKSDVDQYFKNAAYLMMMGNFLIPLQYKKKDSLNPTWINKSLLIHIIILANLTLFNFYKQWRPR